MSSEAAPASQNETTGVEPTSKVGGKAGYTTGDLLPSTTDDTHAAPTAEEIAHANVHHALHPEHHSHAHDDHERRKGRDSFFHHGTKDGQAAESRENILREVHVAQEATLAGDHDRDARSRSRTREFIRSVSRSLSRDPFFHRGHPEDQAKEQKETALAEVRHALEGHAAGVVDAEKRHSRSRSRPRGHTEEAVVPAAEAANISGEAAV